MEPLKVYTFKGLKFKISDVARPNEIDVVYFSSNEWQWMRDQNISAGEFKVLWLLRKQDYTHQILPDGMISEPARLANIYGPKCIEALKGKKDDGE